MGTLACFGTETFASRERAERWSAHWETAVGLQIRPLDEATFNASCDMRSVDPMRICRIRVRPHEAHRTASLIRRVDHDLLKLVFQVAGVTRLSQHGEQTILRPGHWTIYDMSQPYFLSNEAPTEQIALLVPRTAFAGLANGVRLLAIRPHSALTGVSRLLQRCAQGIVDDLPDSETALDGDIGAMMLDLLRLTVKDRLGAREGTSMQETMQARVRSFIRRNLHDPELNLDGIARAMHCTKRYLHKVFSQDQTISEYIWSLRLRRCGEDLVAPENARRSITDIAFANGFSNSAHFSRVFKAHYGVSPRTFRTGSKTEAIPARVEAGPIGRAWRSEHKRPLCFQNVNIIEAGPAR